MISSRFNPFRSALPLLAFLSFDLSANAADLYWDANGATAGTGNSTTASLNTWSNANTWRDGSTTGTLQSWADGNTAVFGGTAGTVTLSSGVTVNQIKFLTTAYALGIAAAGPISFSGTYGDAVPTIDTTGGTLVSGKFDATVNAKIIGSPAGGIVIKDINDITLPTVAGRLYLDTSSTSDFVGDVTLLSGNLHVLSNLGNTANKIILKGGALYGNAATTYNVDRAIVVTANSGIASRQAAGTETWNFNGPITGSANLTRYNGSGAGNVEIFLKNDMSGFTGVFENRGGTSPGFVSIQTSATSGGVWKLTSGTLKLNTTNDTHIANGTGKSDLLMNGGTLDMNGKLETINGLSGASGIVQNQAASTTSTLTLGDADTTATYGGSIRNNSGTGGTVALTKTGTGTQTLAGTLSYTGATTVNGGKLIISSTGLTPVTVAPTAMFGVKQTTAVSPVNVQSLTTAAGSIVQFDTGSFGTIYTPVITTATFTPGSTTLLKLNGYNFTTGVMPLIKYTTLDGAGFAGLDKQLPYRMVASLVNNTTDPLNTTIDLDITSAETAVWKGEVGGTANGDWDINPDAAGSAGTFNWKTSVAGTATRYAQGPVNTDQVTFDDSASGTTTVNLTTTLAPTHVLVNNTTAKTYTFTGSGKISGETELEKDSDGTLIIANTTVNDFTGGTLVRDGVLRLGDGATNGVGRLGGSISISSPGTLAFFYPEAVTVTNPISGGGSVLKLGPNTLTFNATSDYSGGTTLSTGTVAASSASSLGGGMLTLGDASTGSDPVELTLNNRIDLANNVTVSANGAGAATISASNTGTGTTNPATFAGTVTLMRATTFRSDIVGDNLAFTGRITSRNPDDTDFAPVTLTISGGQTVSLENATNNFSGDILVTGTGTSLQAKLASGSEVIPNSVNVDLAAGTFLKLAVAGSAVETIARLTGTGIVERPITGTQTLGVGTGNVSSTFGGVIRNGTGSVALRKVDSGTFTLTNTNTYSGSTSVLGGTLLVNGSITSAALVSDDTDPLIPSGTLGGTGTVAAVTVSATGKISPATGTTIGTLTALGQVSFASATEEYIAQINSDGTPASDRIAITGNLVLNNAKLTITDLGTTTLSATTRLILATYSGTRTGTFNGLAEGADVVIGSNTFKIKYDDPEGTGKAVTLNKAATGGYSAWATTNGVGAADADHDNDGVENGAEYVLGTDPKAASTTSITATTTPTEFKFTFTRSDASETPDTAVFIEVSNDLVTWTANSSPHTAGASSAGSVTVVENPAAPAADPGTDTVTLTVARDTQAKFARLRVVVTP